MRSSHQQQAGCWVTPGGAGPLVADTAQTFEGKVLDAAGQPVSGVALQFAVTGSNSYTNAGSTNTNGVVTFSYTGTNTGLDVAPVTATSLTSVAPATANVAWARPSADVALSAVTASSMPTRATLNVPSSQQPAFTDVLTSLSWNLASQPYTGGAAIDGWRSPATVVMGDGFDTVAFRSRATALSPRVTTGRRCLRLLHAGLGGRGGRGCWCGLGNEFPYGVPQALRAAHNNDDACRPYSLLFSCLLSELGELALPAEASAKEGRETLG
ncbi:MAG: Ig-like domain-containing protein [Bryobacterales bacterium]|nr:Ig-like domain-containing protein [Bryobacterales bacterium]